VVFGQDEAIEQLAASIKLARAGLREPNKPIGSYLFSGPTGVGKTEVAKQLASTMGIELLRFDMSEYMERHTVSRLIGAPPGYVGYDQGGLLTDAVDQHPHCVSCCSTRSRRPTRTSSTSCCRSWTTAC
jgi:ATP-dependent Clp protease ATP-binding subunit ClpA